MQRLFTVFPSGMPGLALFILRSAVAATLLLRLGEQWSDITTLYLTGYCFSSVALVLGVFTPIVALLAVLLILVAPPHKLANENIFQFIVESIALSLLGPGAYSIDALKYGRRTFKPPSSSDDSS